MRAVFRFKQAQERGATLHEATIVAYEVCRGAGTYEKHMHRLVTHEGKEITEAERYIKRTLNPMLCANGLIPPAKLGRPNGKSAKK